MKKQYHRATWMMFFAVIAVIILLALERDKATDETLPQTTHEATTKDQELGAKIDISEPEQFVEVPFEAPRVISRGLAVKMVALSKEDKDSIVVRDREIDFEDSSREDWYDKYFNVAVIEGWYEVEGNQLNPLNPLTYGETLKFGEYFQVDLVGLGIKVEGKEKEEIAYSEWLIFYKALLDKVNLTHQAEVVNLIVFATPTLSNTLAGWSMATDHGQYTFEGITIDGCINKEVSFLVRDKEVLYIQEILDENPILTNAYIVNVDIEKHAAEVYMGGVSRTIPMEVSLKLEKKGDFIADIKLLNNKLVLVTEKENVALGVVKKITNQEIELEGIGKKKLAEDVKFYSTVDQLEFTNYESVVVGYDTAAIILDEDQVAAVIVRDKVKINKIRVAINTTGFKQLFHENVRITAPQAFKVVRGKIEEDFDAKHIMDLNLMDLEPGERVLFVPGEGGTIQITSISRGSSSSSFNPKYRGIIEIERVEEGYLIVNEVDLEAYLYSVVPSEMPSSYGLEAAKVQAICARSYAYTQVYSNRFCDYGAHVDDSTTCQVYNNTSETVQSIQAVNDTNGQLLSFKGNIISTNFFSTSCGITSDSGDVWANYATKEFPTASSEFLRSKYQWDQGTFAEDFSDEAQFRKFILNKELPSFDAEFPFYRWETVMTADQIEATINKNIGARYHAQPKLIKTLDSNNVFRSRPVEDIGDLLDISVYSRGKSGIVTELVVQGTKGVFKIATEYNIRALLAPINYVTGDSSVILTKNDEKTVSDLTLMPSAFYVFDKVYDSKGYLSSVAFYGGGYGHGVGMSQNGAKAMVDLGYSYEDILDHYYEGTELITID